MHTITQHTALAALYRALNPGEQLIDGRSERDRLWFLSEFAGLLNFYNTNNDPQGNWKPLLLKDPVFLLASISKTSFAHYYSRYRYTCLAIDKSPTTAVDYTLLAQLFGRLYDVYQPIGCWAYYMVQSIETYELKTYVTGLVQTTFSPYYWALMLMRKHLFALCREVLETPVEPSDGPTDYFATALWQQNKGIASWWETLGFSEQPPPLNPASPNDTANYRHCFEQLIKIGEDLFGFFKSIIAHSVNDFEKQSLVKSHYPDTTLLRAFVHLLRVQQRQLNGLARQHLDFYYRQLLQQNPLPAQPDKVFVCATLKTNDAVYHLPSGTGLLAGVDANKNPIVFTTVGDSILNPAIITSAATLSLMQDTSATPGLYLDSNKPIATVQYLPNGQVQSSPSFGGSPSATAQAVAMGVSFASPMLYLPEGMRTITCHFLFNKAQDSPVLQGASFYLSTAKDWLPLTVPGQATVAYTDAAGAITTTGPFAGAQLTIQLDAAQPAIQAFALNPDGYASTWPLLKILFASITSAASPAYIQSLTIDTTVTGLKNLRLFNDNGALATKGPFTPFGPMPLRNSQFIIGSNEIFSKPFTQLSLQFDWANLPSSVTNNTDNFETYYSVYNQYCQKYPVGPSQGSPAGTDNATAAPAEATGWLGKLAAPLKWIGGKLKQGVQWIAHEARHIISDSAPAYTPQQPYNNGCFTVDFALLDSAGWQPFALQAPSTYPPPPLPTDPPPVISVQPYGVAQSLFRVNQANNQLTATSIFSYTAPAKTDAAPADTDTDGFVPDPNIQTGTLDFTDTTDTGFVRMSLTGPTVGFGSELYTNVVGWVATQNAMAIAKSAEWFFWNEPTLIPNANPPFAPSAGSLTAQYTASQQYDLTVQTGSYPLQCFLYGPFAQYAVYNNQPGQNIPPDQVITNVGGMPLAPDGGQEAATTETALPPSGVPLFPSFAFAGALFLQLQQLIPSTLQLFFELAGKYGGQASPLSYSYLSPQGWQPLPLLQDATDNFSCSGILQLGIPDNITATNVSMPGNGSWICIAATGNLTGFAETVYCNINGLLAQRSETAYLAEEAPPHIPSNTITKPATAIPALASLIQPFASFGGAAMESIAHMNKRVSLRLHTKDRLVAQGDFYAQLSQQFSFLFHCKVYAPNPSGTALYLVRRVAQDTQPNAYLPYTSACEAQAVQEYVSQRTAPFANCTVQNFTPQYISVYALVTPLRGYSQDALKLAIGQAINLYLSPWINSVQKQTTIDQPLTNTDIAGCIMAVAGVGAVTEVRIKSEEQPPAMPYGAESDFDPVYSVAPISPGYLLVSSLYHTVQFNQAA